jgi:hypothetical protein
VKRIRLPDLGSHEFEAAYRAAVAGQPLPPRTRPSAQSLARQGEAGALASADQFLAQVKSLARSSWVIPRSRFCHEFVNCISESLPCPYFLVIFGIDFQCNLVIIQEV